MLEKILRLLGLAKASRLADVEGERNDLAERLRYATDRLNRAEKRLAELTGEERPIPFL